MNMSTVALLAVALSMDAFAVSICNGIVYVGEDRNVAFSSAFAFGLAQALMPVIGYFLGNTFLEYIVHLDHWIALILLCAIGGKMVKDSFDEFKRCKSCSNEPQYVLMDTKVIVLQAIATSIDALAVGIGLAVMQVNIAVASTVIGITTFAFCFLGCKLGKKLGEKFSYAATFLGGLVLIAIGLKIFAEHVFYI